MNTLLLKQIRLRETRERPRALFLFQLAEHLHRTVEEIFEMNEAELKGWVAYFKIKEKKERLKKR